MKRISLAIPTKLLVLASVVVAGSLQAQAKEYIVKYRSSYALSTFNVQGMQIMDEHAEGRLLKVNIDDSKSLQISAMANLLSNPNVEYVVPNIKLSAFFRAESVVPTTQALKPQWAIQKVKAEQAWQKAGRGSQRVVVAVIDTGTDYRHQSLAPNMVKGFNFIENNNDPDDKTSFQNPGHGTHCSGIVGATGKIEGGIVGLSPDVSIMPLRFLDENGSGDLMNAIKAVDYAIAQKVDVISASWGAKVEKKDAMPLVEAVERANKAGIPFVAAAANDGKNNDTVGYFPTNANTDNIISVAASGQTDAKPSWSNYGKAMVHVSAPGEGIISTLPKNKYGDLSGTSMATPLVAGLVALIKSQNPTLTPLQIRSILQASGDKVAIEVACNCRVNALTAIEMAMAKTMFVSPNAFTLLKGETRQFEAVFGTAPFRFESSNTNAATIDNNGMLTAVSEGETIIKVTDASGKVAQSNTIFVGIPKSGGNQPGDPNQPADPAECPLGDQQLCDVLCQVMPDAPFCKK